MKLRICLIGCLIFAANCLAQQPPPEPELPAPQITAEQRARFWRANAEVLAAQAQLRQAQAGFEAARQDMQKTCGERALVSRPDGEPMCAAPQPKINLQK